jgi:hypothetical protein
MATFFINDTGVVNTASIDSDSIFIQSASVPASEILGLAGSDTINLTEGAAANNSAAGIAVKGGEGNDLILVSSLAAFSAGGHTIIGGAGNDTINLSGSTLAELKGNDGADLVTISGGGTIPIIGLAKGADTITLEDSTTVTRLSLGDGHDLVAAGSKITFATAASVIGGGGRDTIQLTVAAAGQASAYINGGALQDLISADGIENNSTVKGMGGADTITLSGDAATTAFVAAGAGADVVNYSGLNVGTTIAGGAGSDSIAILDDITTVSALVIGGSDADSISFNGIADEADYSKVIVNPGQGADTITFSAATTLASGVADSTKYGVVTYSSFSESNLATQDLIEINGGQLVSGGLSTQQTVEIDFTDSLSSVGVTEGQGAVAVSDANFSGNIAASVATLSGDYSVSATTAMAGTVDTLTVAGGKGAAVLVTTKGGSNFLFVQGGTAGTDDDSIIGLGTLSGAGIAIASNDADITFSGQA